MSWDLAISDAGDFIFSAHDLAGVSGTDLLNQRITTRLKLHRGEWTYDDSETLGSQLYRLTAEHGPHAQTTAVAYARDALRDMQNEIRLDTVDVQLSDTGDHVILIVHYTVLGDNGAQPTDDQSNQDVEIALTLGGTI